MSDWIVTLPASFEWPEYEAELLAATLLGHEMHFKVPPRIKSVRPGDRCFITWRGFVRGWMHVRRVEWRSKRWRCETTGRIWSPGVYVVRAGPWHRESAVVAYKGFQGIRRYAYGGDNTDG